MAFGGGPKSGGGSGPLLEDDLYPARITGIWYLGLCPNKYDPKKPDVPTMVVNFTFEERYDIPADEESGREAYTGHKNMTKNYGFYSDPKSNWYALVKAVLGGKEPSDDDLRDPTSIYGKPAYVEIEVNKSGYSNVKQVLKKNGLDPKIDKANMGIVPSVFDISEFTPESFSKLPAKGLIRKQVVLSNEFSQKLWDSISEEERDLVLEMDARKGKFQYQVRDKFASSGGGDSSGAADNEMDGNADFDDDIPF